MNTRNARAVTWTMVSAFGLVLLSCSGGGSDSGVSGTGGTRGENDADWAALEALATEELSGPAIVGMIAGDRPLSACTAELDGVLHHALLAA
jgi:hypothetical protein